MDSDGATLQLEITDQQSQCEVPSLEIQMGKELNLL
jgi:hypothetical protein